MWKLRSYLSPYKTSVILAPLFMVLEVSMDLWLPALMASIVNNGIIAGDLAYIQRTGLLMLGVAFIGLLGGVGCTIFSSYASQNVSMDLRNSLFTKIQTFSFRNIDELKTGSLITRLTNDVVQVQTFVQMMLRSIRSPLLFIGSFIMALVMSPRLSLILLIAIPLLFVFLMMLIRRSFPLFTKVQAMLDGVNSVLQENLSGIRVVKAFVRSDYERERFAEANQAYTGVAIKATRLLALNMPVMTLILNLSIVAVLWFGGKLTLGGSLSSGELIAFINYVTQLLFAMLMITNILTFISRAKVSADRIQEVFDTEPEIHDPDPADSREQRTSWSGEVEFHDVSFDYGGQHEHNARELILKNISFKAKPGQTTAILGETGSGKSSLVHLIPRLYEATSGQVRIDGHDVRDIPMDELRGMIGMTLQQSVLFSGKIIDNIRYGRPDASYEEVVQAAQAAQAHEFIMQTPEGYDTVIGQKGVNLSGGQKQRISIARALLIRPRILILDDSTSAVDVGTESRIQLALKELVQNSTSIIIAQRISSVMEADQILVLDNGTIAAQGTHKELLQASEIYQDIYRSQRKEDHAHAATN
ncbi:ATP-binding cassette domain-containing protein [Paenibacillus sp. HJL G12]|uniref:ATP-binding cassette domain-containing protein n=1 Tax=Paenibacillus dendrobii TaxID=2691084 RepID=A0A7X3IM29_9BACL|nr:ABC transporter ATP-binding protein [Paenibacillus dendrobii]MWV46467.1 ATP-binding cassette domain-containing protein [Paenibacillus dendrobii]